MKSVLLYNDFVSYSYLNLLILIPPDEISPVFFCCKYVFLLRKIQTTSPLHQLKPAPSAVVSLLEVLRHRVGDELGVPDRAVSRAGGPLVAVIAGDEAVAQVDQHPGDGYHCVHAENDLREDGS